MTRRGPLRVKILAHVERAGHSVASEFSCEAIRQRRAVDLTYITRNPNLASGNGTDEVAGHEIALMSAYQLIPLLLHIECMSRATRGELDLHIPASVKVRGRSVRRFRPPAGPLGRKDFVQPVSDDFHLVRMHHVSRDRNAAAARSVRHAPDG